jgi:probable F420-dependent oxidoreductase
MKFGVCIPHYGRAIEVENLTQMAVRAEELGFDSIWVTDHLIVPHEIPGRTDIVYRNDMLEPLTFLTHLGAVTNRVSIGTSVVILPYRNPIILGKMIATADVLSRGRVIFGAAVGWMEGEFDALNAPFAERGPVSNEYIRLLKELWASPTPSFQGKYFQFSEVTVSPMPVQRPHPPVWIGGRSRRAIRRAVNLGDGWHPTQMEPDELEKNVDYMKRYSASVGRESPPLLSFRGTLSFDGDANGGQRPPLSGTTGDIVADVHRYAEVGVEHIIMEVAGDDYSDKFRAMERFVREVRPRIPA